MVRVYVICSLWELSISTGLPAQHFSYVKNIDPGLPLFLFNYSDRKIHGIFEAVSKGQMYIDPYAWTADCSERTQYPAQVLFAILTPKLFDMVHDNGDHDL